MVFCLLYGHVRLYQKAGVCSPIVICLPAIDIFEAIEIVLMPFLKSNKWHVVGDRARGEETAQDGVKRD